MLCLIITTGKLVWNKQISFRKSGAVCDMVDTLHLIVVYWRMLQQSIQNQ